MAIFLCIGVFVSILSFIFFQIIRRHNRDVPVTNWPIIGMLPSVLQNLSNIHDYVTLLLKHYGFTLMFQGAWFTNTSFILTGDPVNVHHITSKNFGNYGKGPHFNKIFEALGGGIFNSDFHAWKQERTILHSLLKRKSFEIFLQQTVKKKLENYPIPFLDHASKGVELDLQDAFQRFTFDTTCSIAFGYDPNCLPNKFTKLSHFACEKALIVMENVVFYRHITPTCLWKLQEWLQIGQEKKFKEAKENFDKFLHERIESKLREEQSRRNSTEKVDDTHSDLLRVLMEEAAEKGQIMYDKYLRDTAFALVAAGSGTISAALSWFFWLVSTHPVVEAKILREIKDNCVNQDGNLIASSVEEFGKLVYLHGAVCEALRLFPSVPFNHKCAIKSDILPSGHHVGPNTMIIYSLYSMGRMEQIWGDDCLEFKPERWISKRGSIINIPSYKFIVFDAGPRSCLGKETTLIEMKMVAVAILWRFHMQVVEAHPITPRLSVVLTMEHGLKVKVTERCI